MAEANSSWNTECTIPDRSRSDWMSSKHSERITGHRHPKMYHSSCKYKGEILPCNTPSKVSLFQFGSYWVWMFQAAWSSPVESRFHRWWGLSDASFHTRSLLLAMGAMSPVKIDILPPWITWKACQFELLLSHSHFHKQFFQITFKYDPFNQVTQCNTRKMQLHYLFLSPLILLYLSWITLLKMWQVYASHNRTVTILALPWIQHDTKIVSYLTLFDIFVYWVRSSMLSCTKQGKILSGWDILLYK